MDDYDPNSKGVGLLVRVGGIIMPLAAPFAVSFLVSRWREEEPASAAMWPLRIFAFPWGWISSAYRHHPLAFGTLGIVTIVFLVVLAVRRDRRGVFAILVWTLFWGWLLAMFTGYTD